MLSLTSTVSDRAPPSTVVRSRTGGAEASSPSGEPATRGARPASLRAAPRARRPAQRAGGGRQRPREDEQAVVERRRRRAAPAGRPGRCRRSPRSRRASRAAARPRARSRPRGARLPGPDEEGSAEPAEPGRVTEPAAEPGDAGRGCRAQTEVDPPVGAVRGDARLQSGEVGTDQATRSPRTTARTCGSPPSDGGRATASASSSSAAASAGEAGIPARATSTTVSTPTRTDRRGACAGGANGVSDSPTRTETSDAPRSVPEPPTTESLRASRPRSSGMTSGPLTQCASRTSTSAARSTSRTRAAASASPATWPRPLASVQWLTQTRAGDPVTVTRPARSSPSSPMRDAGPGLDAQVAREHRPHALGGADDHRRVRRDDDRRARAVATGVEHLDDPGVHVGLEAREGVVERGASAPVAPSVRTVVHSGTDRTSRG